jgi:hypothetical protein
MENKKDKEDHKEEKITVMSVLKSQPKALQVGPQYHLRKNRQAIQDKKLKGGK